MLFSSLSGCKKEDTIGRIIVQEIESGRKVQGAKVRMFIDSEEEDVGMFLCSNPKTAEPEIILETTSEGKVEQCFAENAVISYEVTYSNIDTSFVTTGKLHLERYETVTHTVKF